MDSRIWPFTLRTFSTVVLLCCSLAVFLTYLVPEWWVFFANKVFVYANGWDEEGYLSWQGSNAARSLPGNFPLFLSTALQQLGLSGTLQNLILDTILPPSTALLVFLSLRRRQIDASRAFAYATLICFGSVLFNANNPLISDMLGQTRTNTIWIMSGWEVYASILRTPNPEIPFFLMACAVYGYVRFEKWWLLLLPLPLLYYHTAVPYAFLLMLGFSFQYLRSRYFSNDATALLAATALTLTLMGGGLVILSYLSGLYQPDHSFRQQPYIFSATRRPQFPVGFLAMTSLFALGICFKLLRMNRSAIVSAAVVAIATLGAVNLHIATGFMLSQKNYYDYGLSVFFPLLLVIAIEAVRFDFVRAAILAGALIMVANFSYRSQQIWFRNGMLLSQELAPDIERLRRDPAHAVIPKLELSAVVGYSTALLMTPPLSTIYYLEGVMDQCAQFPKLMANAMTFATEHLPANSADLAELAKSTDAIEVTQRWYRKRPPHPDQPYCSNARLDNKDFYLAGPRRP